MAGGLKRVEDVVRALLSGVGSARSSETAPRQLQLNQQIDEAMGIKPKATKKKKKKAKKKKKKWYSKWYSK